MSADTEPAGPTYIRRAHGVHTEVWVECAKRPRGTYRAFHDAIRRLHRQGLNDCDIARELEIPATTVRRIRSGPLNLPANAGRGQPRKTDRR